MRDGAVTYETVGPVAWLTIDNPARRNAMSLGMWTAVPDCVSRAVADPEVRLIALRGAGEVAFCAGADISQFGENRTGEAATEFYDLAVKSAQTALFTAEKPTLAYIRGICFGGAVSLALSCDLRVGTADARFRIPAARLGLGYSYENVALVTSRLGALAAADLLLSARTIEAAEALRMGLIGQLFPVADCDAQVASYVALIGENAPLTLRAVKGALSELARPEGQRDTRSVSALVEACTRSSDYREGQAAFKEKRTPVFRGE